MNSKRRGRIEMHTQANDDYVPFGDEWRRECPAVR